MPDLCRPLLRPGVRVVRRDDLYLQVGVDPGLVLRDTEETRGLLTDLTLGRLPSPAARASAAWCRLLDRGLVVDGGALLGDLPADGEAARAVASAYAGRADGAATMRRRRDVTVLVDAPSPLAGQARRLLRTSGVGVARDDQTSPSAVLLVTLGVVDRSQVDGLVQADRPHLLVQCIEDAVHLGPFVVPGLTACLRCVDARLAEADPRRGLVLDQLARAGPLRADGIPEPVDPATAAAAVAWAVRDLVSWVDAQLPTTWSASIVLGPGMHQVREDWPRHPRCGCAWLAAAG